MGMTQKELAEKCNLATGTIQQYELDKRSPKNKDILKKLGEALNVSVIYLLWGEEGEKKIELEFQESDKKIHEILKQKFLSNKALKKENGKYVLSFSEEDFSIEELLKILEYSLILRAQRNPEKVIELSNFLEGNF